MEFEWDPDKALANERKHRTTFREATTVFGDAVAVTFPDPDHSIEEQRFLTFGASHAGRLLIVAHTDRGSRVRIISGRELTPRERRIYEQSRTR